MVSVDEQQSQREEAAPTDTDGLSEAALAYLRWQEENPDAWGDQDENGVDLTHLRENLKLTPAERLRKLDDGRRALQLINDARNRPPLR